MDKRWIIRWILKRGALIFIRDTRKTEMNEMKQFNLFNHIVNPLTLQRLEAKGSKLDCQYFCMQKIVHSLRNK